MEGRYALINILDNIVTNVIVWDGNTGPDGWNAPEGFFVVESATANIGDLYNSETGEFVTPPTN